MKAVIILILMASSLSKSYGQKLISFKEWQTSVTAAIGYNYHGGHDLHFMANTRVASSNFGIFGAFGTSKEMLTVDSGLPDYKETVRSNIFEIGVTHSFYDKIVVIPLNVYVYFGIAQAIENSPISAKNNTFGNSFGVGLEYYLSKNFRSVTIASQNKRTSKNIG